MGARVSGRVFAWAALVEVAVTGAAASQAVPGRGAVLVEPAEVVAGMFYDGARVRVSAAVPAGVAVAVSCMGEAEPLRLNRKGKVLGLVWMNVGEVWFERVPTLYLLHTSTALAELAPLDSLARLGLGYEALRRRIDPEEEASSLYPDLVRLEERDGLWRTVEGSVDVRQRDDGSALAVTEFLLPARARPGVYRVRVFTFSNGRGEPLATGEVRVRQEGVVGFVAALAAEHGLLYGLLAVLVAVGAGLMTGVAFGLGSKQAH